MSQPLVVRANRIVGARDYEDRVRLSDRNVALEELFLSTMLVFQLAKALLQGFVSSSGSRLVR